MDFVKTFVYFVVRFFSTQRTQRIHKGTRRDRKAFFDILVYTRRGKMEDGRWKVEGRRGETSFLPHSTNKTTSVATD